MEIIKVQQAGWYTSSSGCLFVLKKILAKTMTPSKLSTITHTRAHSEELPEKCQYTHIHIHMHKDGLRKRERRERERGSETKRDRNTERK